MSEKKPQALLDEAYPYRYSPVKYGTWKDAVVSAIGKDGMTAEGGEADSLPRILLLGAKYGETAIRLAMDFPIRVDAVEADTEAVFYGKQVADRLELAPRLTIKTGTPERLLASDATYDAVLIDTALQGVKKEKSLRECRRTLKPEGVFIVFETYWKKGNQPQYVKDCWETPTKKLHSLEEWQEMFTRSGFADAVLSNRSDQLKSFYTQFQAEAHAIAKKGFEDLKPLKSLVKQYKHETDVYLKMGGMDYLGMMGVRGKSEIGNRKSETSSG